MISRVYEQELFKNLNTILNLKSHESIGISQSVIFDEQHFDLKSQKHFKKRKSTSLDDSSIKKNFSSIEQ